MYDLRFHQKQVETCKNSLEEVLNFLFEHNNPNHDYIVFETFEEAVKEVNKVLEDQSLADMVNYDVDELDFILSDTWQSYLATKDWDLYERIDLIICNDINTPLLSPLFDACYDFISQEITLEELRTKVETVLS